MTRSVEERFKGGGDKTSVGDDDVELCGRR